MSNRELSIRVIQELIRSGVREFVLCPGGRNSPFVNVLSESSLTQSFWYEERSAAFYALGRVRATRRPVAIVTTSGTAAGELLPAMMEAYYTSLPLIAVTADRPRSYRGTNAPQTADQVGLFGTYAPLERDLEGDELCSLQGWNGRTPAHINLCFDEPEADDFPYAFHTPNEPFQDLLQIAKPDLLEDFLGRIRSPLVVVNAIPQYERATIADFLLRLNAPVYLEGVSGLCHDTRLSHLRITDPILKMHDSVLRIGGIPTHRIWRDLEEIRPTMQILSISEHPFPGLSSAPVIHTRVGAFLEAFKTADLSWEYNSFAQQHQLKRALQALCEEEPLAEASLVRTLSGVLPASAQIFLGNSMPIRNWDLVANEQGFSNIVAVRGLNGIDGQLSCFFGLCEPDRLNVALVGDLTALYDFPAAWCAQDGSFDRPFAIVVINNKGGKIFARKFRNAAIQNYHGLHFAAYAKFWNLPYQHWQEIPSQPQFQGLIELEPDPAATERFCNKWDLLKKEASQKAFLVHP